MSRRLSGPNSSRPKSVPDLADLLPTQIQVQGVQLNMVVFFWYLGNCDLFSVHVYSSVHWTSQFVQGTRKSRQFLTVTTIDQEELCQVRSAASDY